MVALPKAAHDALVTKAEAAIAVGCVMANVTDLVHELKSETIAV